MSQPPSSDQEALGSITSLQELCTYLETLNKKVFIPGVEYHTSEEKHVLYRYGNRLVRPKTPQENEFRRDQFNHLSSADMELRTFNRRAQIKAITMITNISQQAIKLMQPKDLKDETSTEISAMIARLKKLNEVADQEVAVLVKLENFSRC